LDVYGGVDATEVHLDHLRLEPSARQWIRVGEVPPGVLLARAEPVNDRVYIFGGAFDAALTAFNHRVWISAGDRWLEAATLPHGEVALSASAVIGDHVYLFGGCSAGPTGIINRQEGFRFDTKSAEWQPLRPLPRAMRAHAAVAIDERHILLTGGYWASAEQVRDKPPDYGFSSATLIYDTRRDEYSVAEPLPGALAGMEIMLHNGAVFVSGGENRTRGRSACLLSGTIQDGVRR
jgi:N-acetylneuraminic acid mutarotase